MTPAQKIYKSYTKRNKGDYYKGTLKPVYEYGEKQIEDTKLSHSDLYHQVTTSYSLYHIMIITKNYNAECVFARRAHPDLVYQKSKFGESSVFIAGIIGNWNLVGCLLGTEERIKMMFDKTTYGVSAFEILQLAVKTDKRLHVLVDKCLKSKVAPAVYKELYYKDHYIEAPSAFGFTKASYAKAYREILRNRDIKVAADEELINQKPIKNLVEDPKPYMHNPKCSPIDKTPEEGVKK